MHVGWSTVHLVVQKQVLSSPQGDVPVVPKRQVPDPAGAETVEVPPSNVKKRVNTSAFLVVLKFVEICQIRVRQIVVENPVVRQKRNSTVQVVQKTEEMSLLQSIDARRLVAQRDIGQKGPEDHQSPARVEDHAGSE